MATVLEVTLVIIATTLQVVGISLNICIVFFKFKSLKNELNINPSILIYFAMGLVNVFMQLQFMAQDVLSVFLPQLFFTREVAFPLIVLSLIFMFCSFWLTCWLCAYYCLTIVSTSHHLIIMLRRVLSSFLPHILLLTGVSLIFMSLPCIWILEIVQLQTNSTLTGEILLVNPIYIAIAAVLGSCLPFILTVTSTGVTTITLLRHIIKMKHNISGHNCPNIQILISATRTMILLLTFSTIFCVFELMYFAGERKISSDRTTLIGWFLVVCFPSIQALIIIQAIPKLRKSILEKLCFRKEINAETYNI